MSDSELIERLQFSLNNRYAHNVCTLSVETVRALLEVLVAERAG